MRNVTTRRQRDIVNSLLGIIDDEDGGLADVESAIGTRIPTAVLRSFLEDNDKQYSVDRKVELFVDDGGVIRTVSWLGYLNVLDGLELRRFRRCVVCNKRFYAAREDARCCSQLHNSRLRQQEYRHPGIKYSDYDQWISRTKE